MIVNESETRAYRFGVFLLDLDNERLLRNTEPVKPRIKPLDFKVLLFLVRKRGQLVKRDELFENCWDPDKPTEDQALNLVIHRLRESLDDLDKDPKYIETVPKRGYCFIAEVSEVRGSADEMIVKGGEPPSKSEDASSLSLILGKSRAEESPDIDAASTTPNNAEAAIKNEERGVTSSSQTEVSLVEPAPPAERDASPIFAWAMIIIASLFICVVLAQVSDKNIPGTWIERFAFLAQLLVVIWAWVLTRILDGPKRFGSNKQELEDKIRKASGYDKEPDDWKVAKGIAERALRDYKTCWYLLLSFWGLLYIVLAILRRYPPDFSLVEAQAIISRIHEAIPWADPQVISKAVQQAVSSFDLQTIISRIQEAITLDDSQVITVRQALSPVPISSYQATWKILAILFNNCNSLMVALGYIVLNKPTVIERDGQTISDVPWVESFAVVVAVTLIEAGVVFLSPKDKWATVLEVFDWISGIGGAVALALYIGRLQSKFLNLPHSILHRRGKRLGANRLQTKFLDSFPGLLIIALYCYAAIQPLYSLIGKYPKVVAVVILYVALFLKGLLCYCIIRLFQSGRLLFYFVRVRRTSSNVEDEWQDFNQLLA